MGEDPELLGDQSSERCETEVVDVSGVSGSNPVVDVLSFRAPSAEPEDSDCVEVSPFKGGTNEKARMGPTLRRVSTRVVSKPSRLVYDRLGTPRMEEFANLCNLAVGMDPQTAEEALSGPQREEWQTAIDKEFQSLVKNQTFKVISELPKGRKAVGSKWIFKVKINADGSLKYKARLVAKGYSQTEGVDFKETFAPVVKYKSLRLLLAVANERDMHVHQMDVTTAYLNGDLEEEIYMKSPSGELWKLQRSIYGLKQAPRCWNKKIHDFLEGEGFKRHISDYATYSKGEGRNLKPLWPNSSKIYNLNYK